MAGHEHDRDGALCDLTECGCGNLTLRVGRVRIDLNRDELSQLHALLVAATRQLSMRDELWTGTTVRH